MSRFAQVFFLIVFALLLCLPPGLNGLDPAKRISQYVHYSWDTRDNLPQGTVWGMTQTSDGYLWLGTEEGLVRFDGIKFTVYNTRNVSQMSGNWIVGLYEDSRKNLWIVSWGGGLLCRNPRTGRFTAYTKEHGLSHMNLIDIREDADGKLWIASAHGLNVLDPQTGKFQVYLKKNGLPHNHINRLFFDGSQSLWIGTENGLSVMKEGSFSHYDSTQGLAGNVVWSFCKDRQGTLWVGTDRGLSYLEKGETKGEQSKPFTIYNKGQARWQHVVWRILQDRDDNLWVGTDKGICRIRSAGSGSFTEEYALKDKTIYSAIEDSEGNLWLGTRNGVRRIKDGYFTAFTASDGLTPGEIFSIYESPGRKLWIAGQLGLSNLDRRTRTFKSYGKSEGLSSQWVQSVYEDAGGTLWVGTEGGGLNCMLNGKFTVYTTKQGLSGNRVRSILQDSKENLWVGTWGQGLNLFRNGSFTHYNQENGLSDNMVRIIYEDSQGVLWVGTDNGLNRITPVPESEGKFTIKVFSKQQGLPHPRIRSIYKDSKNSMWIGTYGGGLISFKGGHFISVTTRQGLYDDTVFHILEDDSQNLWLSCNKGIFKVSLHHLEEVCDGKRERVTCYAYNENDGMPGRECSGTSQPSSWKTADGKLWFPTKQGIAMVNPGNLNVDRTPPPVKIERVVIDNQDMNYSRTARGKMVLRPGKERFEIYYTALHYAAPGKVLFRCTLQGYDRQWHDLDTRRIAYYNKLPPGDYTFKVRACNSNGDWSPRGASFSFHLQAYFYQTTWFLVLVVLFFLVAVFFGLRFRDRHLKERAHQQQELARKAERASNAKSKFLANMSHEIRTPMNAIMGFTEILDREISDPQHKKYLAAIASSGKTLLDLINDILDLSRIEAGKMGFKFEPVHIRNLLQEVEQTFLEKCNEKKLKFFIEIDPNVPEHLLLDGLRMRQILFNLVGNSVKFTEQGFIKLSMQRPVSGLTNTKESKSVNISFIVQDTGIGIPRDQLDYVFKSFSQADGQNVARHGGTGLGLAITRKLVDMMGGSITLESEEGTGTTITVMLPRNTVPQLPYDHEKESYQDLDIETVRIDKATVLVVDDKPLNRQVLVKFLEFPRVKVLEAVNGKEAVKLTRKHVPDIILMDLKMPVMDGYEATYIINGDERVKHIPIVVVTASAMPEQLLEVKRLGAESHLKKPVRRREVIVELMHYLPYTITRGSKLRTESEAGKRVSDVALKLSPQMKEKLPQLVAILRSAQVSGQWEWLHQTMIHDEVEQFSREMKKLDQQYRTGILSDWADQLLLRLESFNPEKIEKWLGSFPQLIDDIEALE